MAIETKIDKVEIARAATAEIAFHGRQKAGLFVLDPTRQTPPNGHLLTAEFPRQPLAEVLRIVAACAEFFTVTLTHKQTAYIWQTEPANVRQHNAGFKAHPAYGEFVGTEANDREAAKAVYLDILQPCRHCCHPRSIHTLAGCLSRNCDCSHAE